MHSVPSSLLLTAIVGVGTVLLIVLFLRSRRTVTGEVRLRPAATRLPPNVRDRGTLLQRNPSRDTTMFWGLDAAEFEARVSGLLRELGYAVRPAPQSGLHDVDLLLEATNRGVAVQLKRWKAPVGDRSVYALFTGRIHYATDEAWLITTSEFTRKALKLAETTGVRLVDGTQLAEWFAGREERATASAENDLEGAARPSHPSPRPSADPDGADSHLQESSEGTQETPVRGASH
jgi:hypothetical protein